MNWNAGAVLPVWSIAITAAAVSLLLIFTAVRSKVRRLELRVRELSGAFDGRVDRLDKLVSDLVRDLDACPTHAVESYPDIRTVDRAKVARLWRLGRSEDEIAAAVRQPLAKIRMMLKMQKILAPRWGVDGRRPLGAEKFAEKCPASFDRGSAEGVNL